MNRRKFLSYVGCSCGGLLLNSCSTAPITERKQLKIIPEAKLNAQAAKIFEKVKEKEKLSKDTKTLDLIKNPDIITAVANHSPRPFTVGFAAETEALEQHALKKLAHKNLDMIAANDVSQPEQVFNNDENCLHIFWEDGQCITKRQSKTKLAHELLNLIATRIQIHETTTEH